jgi:squalene synthase HpnC
VPWNLTTELARFGPSFTARGVPASRACSRAYVRYVTLANQENFVVVSALLPRHLVPHFQAFYAYCRWSDDLADEAENTHQAQERLHWWRGELELLQQGIARHPVFVALAGTLRTTDMPLSLLGDLLTAFEQDQVKTRYQTYDELLGYCKNSADPVGRVLLYLFGVTTDTALSLSDAICTGLQLANFWQDVSRDHAKGRIYIPLDDLHRFGVTETDLAARLFTPAFRDLMQFQVQRTHELFHRGEGLLPLLPRRVRFDVRLFLRGGQAVLRAIENQGYNTLTHRPHISTRAKLTMALRALWG